MFFMDFTWCIYYAYMVIYLSVQTTFFCACGVACTCVEWMCAHTGNNTLNGQSPHQLTFTLPHVLVLTRPHWSRPEVVCPPEGCSCRHLFKSHEQEHCEIKMHQKQYYNHECPTENVNVQAVSLLKFHCHYQLQKEYKIHRKRVRQLEHNMSMHMSWLLSIICSF